MRTFTVTRDMDLATLGRELLGRALDARRTAAALQQLRALNPHVDLDRLPAGTVLLVPEGPDFEPAATNAVHGGPLDDLEQLVQRALQGAAEAMRDGNLRRAAGRAEVSRALDANEVRRILDGDAELQARATKTMAVMRDDERLDRQAEEILATASRAALDALHVLGDAIGRNAPHP